MYISKIYIQNFKGYKELDLDLRSGINILVGDNETKKTTILEAVNLVLSGYINGIYLTKEKINQFLFNTEVVAEYLKKIKGGEDIDPPTIRIELFLSDDAPDSFMGANNYLTSKKAKGFYFQVSVKEEYRNSYKELLKDRKLLESLPLELYEIDIVQFSGDPQVRLNIPIKSVLVDTTSNFQDISELMIAKKIKSDLDSNDKLLAAQAHRGLKDVFSKHAIHTKLSATIKDKDITVSVDPSAKNSWDAHLSIYFKEIPFSYIGKGRQSMIKTAFALSGSKAKDSTVVLVEEPENHLSHANLNILIKEIEMECSGKQILVTSHNSFVANKLGLDNLILLGNEKPLLFEELTDGTKDFFKKLPGYNTLRLVLCKKAILVEGDADELITQKAYATSHNNKLPIENGIEVVSVNNTYKRYIEIAKYLNKKIAIVVDVDNKISNRNELKADLIQKDKNIEVFFEENDAYSGEIPEYNNNTLEPLLLKYNNLELLNKIFKTDKKTTDELLLYMKENKTECALVIFKSDEKIVYPKYILDAIKFVS